MPNFATDCNQITQEIWPYYQPQHGSFYDNSYQSNGTLIGNNVGQNCWNRNVSSSITNNNCYNNYYEQQSKMTSQSAKSLNGKELNIKEEPSKILEFVSYKSCYQFSLPLNNNKTDTRI